MGLRRSSALASTFAVVLLLFAPPSTPALADGLSTVWQPTSGNWSEAANWSDGEPTKESSAEIPPQRVAIVDQTGEVCRDLIVGIGSKGFGAQVHINAGTLSVTSMFRTGTTSSRSIGTVTQSGGAVTAPLLRLERGGYTAAGGTTLVTECVLAGGAVTVISGGNVNVTTDLTVETGSALTIGGGTLLVGSDLSHGVTVRGEIALVNPNIEVILQNLTLEGSNSRLRVTLGQLFPNTITIAGTFTRGGRFIVSDLSAPNGRYDILTADAISGEFANVDLPATGDWTWGIENSTLYVTKGLTPVANTSWGRLKSASVD